MRYETCNPGQDADSIEAPSKEKLTPAALGQESPREYEHDAFSGNANGKDYNSSSGQDNGHRRNISDATAVNGPGYAATTDRPHATDAPTSSVGNGGYSSVADNVANNNVNVD